ncbi:hypothetical protein I4U23_016364 [Adineta vaga]|nr:hypothetical protein I4U23_016364 [Adineta vaga]
MYVKCRKKTLSSLTMTTSSNTVSNIKECCICTDQSANFLLTCTHVFGDQCFQKWSSQVKEMKTATCPLCRIDIIKDSGYVLVEGPHYDEVKKTVIESISRLPTEYDAI